GARCGCGGSPCRSCGNWPSTAAMPTSCGNRSSAPAEGGRGTLLGKGKWGQMRLSPTAHTDTFCRDRLPPPAQWPEFRFDLPELRYPERLNCAAELLDVTAAREGAGRPCLLSPAETWTYGETVRRTNQLARVLTEDLGLRPGNRVMLRGPNTPSLP